MFLEYLQASELEIWVALLAFRQLDQGHLKIHL